MSIFTQCLITFIACVSISIHFNVKGRLLVFAAFGGAVTYLTYCLSAPTENTIAQVFIATMVASIFSESLARIIKVPATTFLIISIIPLVPGSNLYQTMELAINGEILTFASSALNTLGIAGAIALGILLVSSAFRFVTVFKAIYRK